MAHSVISRLSFAALRKAYSITHSGVLPSAIAALRNVHSFTSSVRVIKAAAISEIVSRDCVLNRDHLNRSITE
jgi:hypothetical protein